MTKRRVVVTGLGAVTPLGNDVKTYWENLLAGVSGVKRISAFDPSDLAVQIAGEVKNFNPLERLDAKLVKRADRFTQFALWAAVEALKDAGIDLNHEDCNRVGVIVGSGMGGIATWEQQHEIFITRGPRPVSPLLIPMMIPDMASGQISIVYGLRGPNYCSVSACASGAHATGVAFRHIQNGDADVMITGGSEAPITKFTIAAFANMGALSKRNDQPEKASRPFDRQRDGFVIAEGCGIYILEELEHALKRGAKIYCELSGYGASADGYHITAPDPEALGAALAMRRALEDAGLKPEDIDYINAHGTSTPLNDAAEVKAITMVFGEHSRQLAVNSTKSMIGHGLGAAGAMEFVATVLSVSEGKLHCTANFEEPDEGVELDFVKEGSRERRVRAALSNSFGFGGHNCCLCVKAWE
ncbi:MAG: beta-ketoacyl-ACP synthase II [candidate division WOR-3 bacterium]|uniref:3-oxoacyl-[acyl-carrier-protein] synthase 2 n=1 Tax=candidate division WOR-3 bacterium TaxID=2052148 RepID=A0A7C1NKI4_UNCW3|nr:beta-ketoacyl-ACP synthase II [candidate division WOR-3 bacterium]